MVGSPLEITPAHSGRTTLSGFLSSVLYDYRLNLVSSRLTGPRIGHLSRRSLVL